MQDYKKLKIWQLSKDLSIEIYRLTQDFPKEELYGLTSQIRRSAISIPANIAEGCGRGTQKDFKNFLNISLGSLHELETLLVISKDVGLMPQDSYEKLKFKSI